MKNEQKAKEIAEENAYEWRDQECGAVSSEEECYKSAMAMADFKDTQPISELGGWHTEPPTEDCKVLLCMSEFTMAVAKWNSPNKMFYDEFQEPIKKWIKWKRI